MPTTVRYNLVLLHTPKRQDIGDFLTIRNMMTGKAPDISVTILSVNEQVPSSVFAELSQRPTLLFSPMPISLPSYIRGHLMCPPPTLTKAQEIQKLQDAAFPVPRTSLVNRAEQLQTIDTGPLAVIKPNVGLRGKGVNLIQSDILRRWTADQLARSASNNQGMIVQQYVNTGAQPISYRVMTVLGDVIYCIKSTADSRLDRLPLNVSASGVPIASNVSDRVIVEVQDPDIVELGRRIHRGLDVSPVLGIDLVRDATTQQLYVLELNSAGWTWHLSSDHGKEHQRTYSLNLYDQFNALKTITDGLIRETRAKAI